MERCHMNRLRPKVFLDTSTRKHAVTHNFVAVPQSVSWGPTRLTVPVAVLGRKKTQGWLRDEVAILPRIAQLAEAGLIECFTSFDAQFENAHRDTGTTTETDLFRRVCMHRAVTPAPRTLVFGGLGSQPEKLEHFLLKLRDARYVELNAATNGHHAVDSFLLWTAEVNGLDCFLTLDKKFLNAFRHQREVTSPVKLVCATELWREMRRFYPVLVWRQLRRWVRVATGREPPPDRGFTIID